MRLANGLIVANASGFVGLVFTNVTVLGFGLDGRQLQNVIGRYDCITPAKLPLTLHSTTPLGAVTVAITNLIV